MEAVRSAPPEDLMDVAAVVAAAHAADVTLIRFEYCDVSGVARTKPIHVDWLENKLTEGVGLTRAQMSINLLENVVHIEGMEPVGEIRLVPDPSTFTVLPWLPGTASVLCDQLDHNREDWGACPRSFLKAVIAKAASMGITINASFENEYYVVQKVDGKYVPYDHDLHTPVYSVIGQDFHGRLLVEVMSALKAQGLQPEQAINEYGGGQQEIAIRYTDALGAADNQMKYRDTVRGVIANHGLIASFAPKPFPEQIGSGAHIHFSLWDDDGRNLLYDPAGDRGMSQVGRQFIAGVTENLPALVAMTAPSANSYRRLQPSSWASNTTAWGYDNRECAVRVASPYYQREEESYNIEYKVSDASANPYLSLGALILCGLDGITRELEPGLAAEHDPARMTPEEWEACKIRPLPSSMTAALDELEMNPVILHAMNDLLARCYMKVRRSEAEAFAAEDVDFEIRHHLYRF